MDILDMCSPKHTSSAPFFKELLRDGLHQTMKEATRGIGNRKSDRNKANRVSRRVVEGEPRMTAVHQTYRVTSPPWG